MQVSIRHDQLPACGFGSIREGLRYFGLHAVELGVNREFECHPIVPFDGDEKLRLDRIEDVERLEEQAAETGVTVTALLVANDFNSTDREKEISWIERVAEVAAHLKIPAVRIDAVMTGEKELPLADRLRIFAAGMNGVLDRTDGLAVEFGIENHGSQGNDPAFLQAVLDSVGSDRLGLTLDTGNFYWAGHPLEEVYRIVERFAPVVKHTHVKNIGYPSEIRNQRREIGYGYGTYVCPIAAGDIDHGRIVEILRRAGYDRDLCIEDESFGKYDQEARRKNIAVAVHHLSSAIEDTS